MVVSTCVAMGSWIDPSCWIHCAISCSCQCSTAGVTKVVVCAILSMANQKGIVNVVAEQVSSLAI